MKKCFFIVTFLCTVPIISRAQGVEFEHGTFSEALTKAKKENKFLFIDFYTEWCAPCKKMAYEVFPLGSVGTIFKDHFIAIKVDAEKGEGVELAKKYKVTGFPTMVWVDTGGRSMYTIIGARNETDFLQEIELMNRSAGSGGLEAMKQQYSNGASDPSFLLNLYNILPDKDRLKPEVAIRYLNNVPDDELFDQNDEQHIILFGQMLDRINKFDKHFFYHYADELRRRFDAGMKINGNYSLGVIFSVQLRIRDLINAAIEKGDKTSLEELLAYQEKWPGHAYNIRDGDVNIMSGRGIGFASSDFIKLQYMVVNDNDPDLFKQMIGPYMNKLIRENSADKFTTELNSFLNKPDSQKAPLNMIYNIFYGKRDLSMKYMIGWIDYFWKNSPSDKKTKGSVSKWALFAGGMNPLQSGLVTEAAILAGRMGNKKDALALIDRSIKLYNRIAIKGSERIIKKLENAKRDIRNDKV